MLNKINSDNRVLATTACIFLVAKACEIFQKKPCLLKSHVIIIPNFSLCLDIFKICANMKKHLGVFRMNESFNDQHHKNDIGICLCFALALAYTHLDM